MRSSVLVTVLGTGTEIGKSVAAGLLVRGAALSGRVVVGLKPVETGLPDLLPAPVAGAPAPNRAVGSTDWEKLGQFGCRAVPPRYGYAPPVSPHLAARWVGETIDLEAIAAWVERHAAEVTIVESAGGAFSPLSSVATNADLARRLGGRIVLVCPGRLGVLHDLGSTLRALGAAGSLPLVSAILVQWAGSAEALALNTAEIEGCVLPSLGLEVPVRSIPEVSGSEDALAVELWSSLFG